MSKLLNIILLSRLPDIRAAGDLGLRLLPQRRPGAGGRMPRGAHAGPVNLQSKLSKYDVCGYIIYTIQIYADLLEIHNVFISAHLHPPTPHTQKETNTSIISVSNVSR